MRIKYLYFLLIIVGVIFMSCDKRKKALEEISTMQMSMDSIFPDAGNMNTGQKIKTNEMIAAYMEFVEQYPADTLSPQFLFEASRLKLMIPDYPAALQLLNAIIEKYPTDEMAANSITTAAALCENVLKDCNKATEYLKQLKEKFPDHPAAVNIDLQIEYVCDPQGYLDAVTGNLSKDDSLFMEGVNDTLQ